MTSEGRVGNVERLGDFVRVRTGKLDANASSKDGEYPFFTCSEQPLRIASFSYDCECVLVAGNGALNVKYYNGKFEAYQRTYILESADAQALDVRYMFHFMSVYVEQLRAMSVGGVIKYIKLGYLTDAKIPMPPIGEQRRIAKVLDRAEALRGKRLTALAQLDSLTQSLFLDLFGDPIKNPHCFAVRPMIELIDPERPISYGILMPGPDQIEGVKYVRVVDMKDGGIELSGIRKTTEAMSDSFRRSLLKPGDLLMSIRGHVGRFAVVPPELEGANITQDTARLAIVGASSIFVRECLRTQGFQRWMAKHTKGVAVRGINLGDVKLMPIILPPRSAQDKFSRQVRAVEKLKFAHRASLAELDALFATLQHRAFNGELFSDTNRKSLVA